MILNPVLSCTASGPTTPVRDINRQAIIPDMDVARNSDDQSPFYAIPRALPHVYSCFVFNETDEVIECSVQYTGRPDEDSFDETITNKIPAHAQQHYSRQFFQPELPTSFCKWVKIIKKIQVKKVDSTILELTYPFDNVIGPVRNWEFRVKAGGIVLSTPPTHFVNVTKYQQLDKFEC